MSDDLMSAPFEAGDLVRIRILGNAVGKLMWMDGGERSWAVHVPVEGTDEGVLIYAPPQLLEHVAARSGAS